MKKIPLPIKILLIVIAAFFTYKTFINNSPKMASKPGRGGFGNRIIEVNVATTQKTEIKLFKEFPARISARKIAQIKPQVSGILKKRLFEEGQKVTAGQELYEIDQTLFKIAIENAKTAYEAAEKNFKRSQSLVKKSAISKKEYDDAKSAYASAKSQLENAQTNINYTKVLAPISGYISKSNITEGNLVNINQEQPLATITQLDPIFVDITIPSKNFAQFKKQDNDYAVTLVIDGIDYSETGSLKFSEVFTNINTDSIKLRAEFDNKLEKLLPGMFVKAKIHLAPINEITILQRATTRNPDGSLSVKIVDSNNIVHVRKIETSGIINHSWIVTKGLNEGENVIIAGYQKVGEGSKVKAVLNAATKAK